MITLDLTSLIILAIATWRGAYMLTSETCPFNACVWIRKHLNLGGVLNCIFCASVWVAGLLLVLWVVDGYWYLIVYVLAISGGALVLRSYTGAGIND